mmetsp:Transcript_29348/g.60113  ORF Transcript_29348/g.60113 Transcript_29348/m.60113 type:complete len:277 (-) Transcript_29348:34-864(-)
MMPTSTLIRRFNGIKATNISACTKYTKHQLQTLPLPSQVVLSHPINDFHPSFTIHFSRGVRSISGCNDVKRTPNRSHLAASTTTASAVGGTENVNMITNTYSSCLFSTTTNSNKNTTTANPSKPQYQYIHPLSQIVLEHLQSRHASWVQKMGLEEGLKLNENGTFVLRFPGDDNDEEGEDCDSNAEQLDGHDSKRGEDCVDESIMTGKNGSIWTMYEPEEKKHYLCVTKGNLVGRYMLQDNKKPAWHSDRRSTPERVQDAVDEMIFKLEEMGDMQT